MGFRAGIGQSDFRRLRQEKVDLIDKTPLISELIQDPSQVLLFPRPRRFGKTTNLSMLRYFFEVATEDRAYLFSDLKVWQDEAARAHFQRHPVIWLSLKDVKGESWEMVEADLHSLLANLLRSLDYLLKDTPERPSVLSPEEQASFRAVLACEAQPSVYRSLLLNLPTWLYQHHGQDVVVLIDEYDTPLYSAYSRGYFQPMMDFMRPFLGGGLKDHPHIYKCVLTGILRVAKESLFSGLNNLAVHSMLSREYVTAFGFTEEEVAYICERLGQPALLDGMREMYNGYLANPMSSQPVAIYNPWSVLCCAKDPGHELQPHWRNTASDDLLRELMVEKDLALNATFEHLLAGGELDCVLDDYVVLRDLETQTEALWTFLWYAGYLKVTRLKLQDDELMATFQIPNREVALAYRHVFRHWLTRGLPGSGKVQHLVTALLTGDEETLEELLTDMLLRHISLFDPGARQPEKLYHGLILGLLVQLEGRYEVRSNPESGLGRADLLLRPLQAGQPGVVMELKVLRRSETIATALKKALDQVETRAYATQLEAAGASPIHTYALLFDGKEAYVVSPASWQARFGG